MPRQRSPDRDKAFELYKKHGGKIDLTDIAAALGLPAGTVRGWKNKDEWEQQLNGTLQKNTERSKPRRGAQPGNRNAVGGPGGPLKPGDKIAEKHGFFSKYLPEETFAIIQQIDEKPPLDILWENIQIAYAAIIRAQSIMYVQDREDKSKEIVGESHSRSVRTTPQTKAVSESDSYSYQVQQAWDKQANFLKAQSRAQSELRSMLRAYDEMLHRQWELATEEQKLRLDKLRLEISKAKEEGTDQTEDDGFLEAMAGEADKIWQE